MGADFGSLRYSIGSLDDNFAAPDFSQDELDGSYRYDDDGRITKLARGSLANSPESSWGDYNYYEHTHRLERIDNQVMAGGKDRSASGNYEYDLNGNIVEDKGLRRKIEYDYRNLPLQVTIYTDETMSVVEHATDYVYDAGGNRVAKIKRK